MTNEYTFLIITESLKSIFRLLENKAIGNVSRNVGNSVREKCKSKHKFVGATVCKAEQVRKYFVNPKIKNEVFGLCVNYIICCLDFRNTEAVVRRCTS